MLSVAAVHEVVMLVALAPDFWKFPGVVGGVVSALGAPGT